MNNNFDNFFLTPLASIGVALRLQTFRSLRCAQSVADAHYNRTMMMFAS